MVSEPDLKLQDTLIRKDLRSQSWWSTPVIPELRRQSQQIVEFEAHLVYIVSLWINLRVRPSLKVRGMGEALKENLQITKVKGREVTLHLAIVTQYRLCRSGDPNILAPCS